MEKKQPCEQASSASLCPLVRPATIFEKAILPRKRGRIFAPKLIHQLLSS